MKRSPQLNVMTMRAALKQYDMPPCRNAITSWISDEMTRTDYSEEMSAELSSSNYTNSTHSSTSNSVVQSLDDISNISGAGSSYVEQWLNNQPRSSTPRKSKSLVPDTQNECTARRNLFTTDNDKVPPTSERPPCIGAENPQDSDTVHHHQQSYKQQQNVSYSTDGQHTTHPNHSIQSDDTLFMEIPLFALPVTYTRKPRTFMKKLQRVRRTLKRSTPFNNLTIL